MRVGSLFSGVGGFDLGLELAGHEIVWQVENDPYCRKVLAKHWPDVTRYKEVADVGFANLEAVDCIAGGFPCGDLSHVGRRAGIEGESSGLWTEYARLVGELRPSYCLVENVTGLLVRGMGRILGDLAAIGYDAEWDCIPAAALGAPHLRARIFVLAYPSGRRYGTPDETIFAGRAITEFHGRWPTEPNLGRVVDGAPQRVDRLRALGNAVVPQVAEWIGRRLPSEEG